MLLKKCTHCQAEATIAMGTDNSGKPEFSGACTDLTCRAEGPVCATKEDAARKWNNRPLLDMMSALAASVEAVAADIAKVTTSLPGKDRTDLANLAETAGKLLRTARETTVYPRKPTAVVREPSLDFKECLTYIAIELGYDCDEYWDWLEVALDIETFPTDFNITKALLLDQSKAAGVPPWQNEITEAFIDEFGPEAVYTVSGPIVDAAAKELEDLAKDASNAAKDARFRSEPKKTYNQGHTQYGTRGAGGSYGDNDDYVLNNAQGRW